jgi:glutamine synthetase
MGVPVEVHHHEVATGGQCEIGVGAGGLVQEGRRGADPEVRDPQRGAQPTARPRPSCPSRWSATTARACTCTSRCRRTASRLFAGDKYGGLSEFALYYIGGIIKHAKAINAFTNPGTNSYKRLVPGFEAPVMLAYSARNRSASIRIPWVANPKARRIEVRFPDPAANPYLAFSAMMMAGLDGIQNKIHPGDPADKDLYDLPPEEGEAHPDRVPLARQALEHLDKDREFLTRGGVFTNDVIDAYIALKMQEVTRFRMSTHPVELDMYYGAQRESPRASEKRPHRPPAYRSSATTIAAACWRPNCARPRAAWPNCGASTPTATPSASAASATTRATRNACPN